jgi:exosortase
MRTSYLPNVNSQIGKFLALSSKSRPTAASDSLSENSTWLQWASVFLLLALIYGRIFGTLLTNWRNDPNYSHGFALLPFCALIVWMKRRSIYETPTHPCWWGLLVVITASGELIVGSLGAESFLSRTSFLFLTAGLVIYFWGVSVFRLILLPWVLFFLAIPIPAIILNPITFQLQLLASYVSTALLGFLAVPVLREGNVIHLSSMSLEVAEACSGLRSLLSLVSLAGMYSYLFEKSNLSRLALVCFMVPIAVVANASRITVTGLLAQYWDPAKAEGFFHEFTGLLIFVVSILMLKLVHIAISRIAKSRVSLV